MTNLHISTLGLIIDDDLVEFERVQVLHLPNTGRSEVVITVSVLINQDITLHEVRDTIVNQLHCRIPQSTTTKSANVAVTEKVLESLQCNGLFRLAKLFPEEYYLLFKVVYEYDTIDT